MANLKKPRLPLDVFWTPLRVLREFHRGKDSFIGFARIRHGSQRPEHLWSVRRDQLVRDRSGWLLRRILKYGFFTVEAFWRHDDNKTRHLPIGPVCRRQPDLRYLNAVFVDLDLEKNGLEFEDVRRKVFELVEAREIPKPSIIVDSGRGMWVHWLLHDEKNHSIPPRGDPSPNKFGYNFHLWRRIQAELTRIFKPLGVDASARDGSRFTRFPGSINLKANRTVGYQVLYADPAHRISYSLSALANAVNAPLTVKPPLRPKKRKVHSRVRKQKRKARIAMYQHRLDQFRRLEKYRRGFKEGTREQGALLLATWLKVVGTAPSRIKKEVIAFGQRCDPVLDRSTCLRRIHAARPGRPIRDTTIAAWLNITNAEKLALKLTWPSVDGKTVLQKSKTSGAQVADRQKLCKKLLKRYGGMTAVKLVARYARRGFKVSPATAARDLAAL
jgi:hypothetical protein